MTILENLAAHSGYFYTTIALLGLLIGSFLNVVIYRLPRMLDTEWTTECKKFLKLSDDDAKHAPFNLSLPRSHCPRCHTEIPGWRNIPLISYLLQRGKCHQCGAAISPRYPLVELVTALLSLFLAWHYGAVPQLIPALFFSWALIALFVIDLHHQLLPDQITLPLLWTGLLFNMQNTFTSLEMAVLGAVIGYLSLWLVYHAYRLLRGKYGFGYGDFKLLAAIGAWIGWPSIPVVILISSLSGAIIGILLILFAKHQYDKPIPFGPYLAMAGWLSLLWGESIIQTYFHYLGLE
ncbi:MAG: A24 family peptidase [Gammaproteobacteria bacterium]|nr:A24 family peptidase [Gammaproteobacteria bacterium]